MRPISKAHFLTESKTSWANAKGELYGTPPCSDKAPKAALYGPALDADTHPHNARLRQESAYYLHRCHQNYYGTSQRPHIVCEAV